VRFQLGITMCLLAGCVVQPTTADPTPTNGALARAGIGQSGSLGRPVPLALVPRIGIEHLPPDESTGAAPAEPRVENQPKEPTRPPVARGPGLTERRDRREQRHTWGLSATDLAAIDDPVARETMQFVEDLVDADRERVRLQLGLPFLALGETTDFDRGPLLHSEEALLAAQEEWAQVHGPGLLRGPMKRLLRRLPFVRQVEVEFDEFRSDHMPLSERDARSERGSFGRVSVRVRANDLSDPVEVAYVYSGVRIGSSQERGRLSLDWDLSSTLRLEVRGSTMYETNEQGMRIDLAYRPDDWTSLHIAVGDDMDFLSTSSIYSLFETPMDGSAGLALYAVHIF